MSDQNALIPRRNPERSLTSAEFNSLADVPPEVEWFANIQNPNTRRAYQNDLRHFMRFAGIVRTAIVKRYADDAGDARPTCGTRRAARENEGEIF